MKGKSSVQVSTLANGIRVVSDTMPAVETVAIGLWVNAGARHEKAEEGGVAHLLEHMAFKGTQRRTALAIAEEIEAVGGQLNAYTGREQTAYYAKVLRGDSELALDILADILINSTFDPEELVRERAVVLQEIGQSEDTPDDCVFDYFQAAAYPDQPMGWSILGEAQIVGAMPRQALIEYRRQHYHGGNIILAAAGAIEHGRLVHLAEQLLAAIPYGRPAQPVRALYKGGERREARDLEQVHLVLGFEGVSFHDKDFYPLSVYSTILGGGMSSRLFQEIREKRGLVYSIHSYGMSYADGGIFSIYAGTGPQELAELVHVVAEQMRHLEQHGVGGAELRRARAQLKTASLMAMESSMARCEAAAQQMLVFNRPIEIADIVAQIEAVGVEDINRVARRLRASAPCVAAIGPLEGLTPYADIASDFGALVP
jgi:predicted Zn-dependent peptidase